MEVDKLLVKLNFTKEAEKSIFGHDLDSGGELENLDDEMCKSFVQNCYKPSSDQKGVIVSTMD